MGWQYSDKTRQLFMDAVQGKTGTHVGEIENADGLGEHGSVACGDALRFTFRVEKNADDPLKDRIVEAKFLTFGCTSAIAASEALCRIIEERGLTPIESLKITNQDIVEYLEGLPTQKIHCSVMGAEALETAVFDWASKRGVDMAALGIKQLNVDENEGRLVCSCFGITEPYLRRKIRELKLRDVDAVTGAIKAGGACGTCRGEIQDIINEIWASGEIDAADSCGCGDPAHDHAAAATPEANSEFVGELEIVSGDSGAPAEAPVNTGFIPLATVTTTAGGDVVQQSSADPATPAAPSAESRAAYAAASAYKRAKLIEETIEAEIRPVLRRDGGDLEIVDVKDNLVYVSLVGSCESCDSASVTLELLVAAVLQERLDPELKVIPV